MYSEDSRLTRIPVELPNGTVIQVEVTQTGREDVAFDIKPFKPVTDAIEGIVQAIAGPLNKVKPDKATVKFGLEVAIEAGQLTAAIVKGASKANLEITLEWSKDEKPKTQPPGA
ncbi:hypothetical protein BST81_25435 [Leptolyngbya sp. 'hensonii']|uniref:CU044_2847 family protein n=1 Tax=Leptolyngbya sp. 'hensonii' TaxID=1922337 RepID=UPI0009501AEA|nr:CU044_2847 family protein [Leptolyngbya sp. 'hensonii']OLP15619.1 hypothetical protein BST81_25435 [Leptolyngbya sp. 'hensonii']